MASPTRCQGSNLSTENPMEATKCLFCGRILRTDRRGRIPTHLVRTKPVGGTTKV
jgi:hypothetical protein